MTSEGRGGKKNSDSPFDTDISCLLQDFSKTFDLLQMCQGREGNGNGHPMHFRPRIISVGHPNASRGSWFSPVTSCITQGKGHQRTLTPKDPHFFLEKTIKPSDFCHISKTLIRNESLPCCRRDFNVLESWRGFIMLGQTAFCRRHGVRCYDF